MQAVGLTLLRLALLGYWSHNAASRTWWPLPEMFIAMTIRGPQFVQRAGFAPDVPLFPSVLGCLLTRLSLAER
jgi:hypothetical protein